MNGTLIKSAQIFNRSQIPPVLCERSVIFKSGIRSVERPVCPGCIWHIFVTSSERLSGPCFTNRKLVDFS